MDSIKEDLIETSEASNELINTLPENYIKIYFFFCCHKNFFEQIDILYYNTFENKVECNFKCNIQNHSDYLFCIYSININKEEKKKKLEILLRIKNEEKKYIFKEINIKLDKTRFIFESLVFKNISDINQLLDNENKIFSVNSKNYSIKLSVDMTFSYYFDYIGVLNNQYPNDKAFINEYSNYLINNYLTIIKSKIHIDEFRNLPSLLKLFVLCYLNAKQIKSFLDKFLDLKIELIPDKLETIDNKFMKLLNIYEYKNNEFFSPLYDEENQIKKNEIIKYARILEKLINIYFIFYEMQKLSIEEKNVDLINEILVKLLKQNNPIEELFQFILDKFDLFAKVYNLRRCIFKIENNYEIDNFTYNKNKYTQLISLQKSIIFFDFSKIIEKFLKQYKNNINELKEIYNTFKRELNESRNIKLLSKLRDYIHNLGIELYNKGKIYDKEIIDFLLYDDYYKTLIDIKKKEKDIFILKGINITSKNSPLINEIESKEIYNLFKEMPHKYLEIFINKLNKIDDFSAFFRILPDNYFNQKSVLLLIEWIKKNINSFSIKGCPTFKEELNRFISIIINQKCKDSLIGLIDFFSEKLGDFCNILFLYILNNNSKLTQEIRYKFINYFTKKENLDLIKYFIENLEKKEDNIINIFLDQIVELSLDDRDIYKKIETKQFKLFKILLEYKNEFINNKKGKYLDNTFKKCKDLLTDIKEQNITFNAINSKDNNFETLEFVERIELLFLFTEKENEEIKVKSIEMYGQMIKNFRIWESNIEDLKEVLKYYEVFFKKSNSQKIKEINSLINSLKSSKLKDLLYENKNTNEFKKYIKEKNNANQYLTLYENSMLFKEIFESNKKKLKEEFKILNESFRNFLIAIKILDEKPEKIQENEFIFYFYEIGNKNELNLDKEIDWLIMKYNKKITEEDKRNLLNSIKILMKNENLKIIIGSFIYFIELYDNINENEEDQKFKKELEESSKLLNRKLSSKEVENIINYIKQEFSMITFDDKDPNYKNKILGLLYELNKNFDSFKFLKQCELSKVDNIREFILDVDEKEINYSDLDEFINVIRFLETEIKLSKSKKDLLNKLINGILDEKKCGKSLINTLKKIDKIKNFLEKVSSGEESCFIKIKKIMEKSFFMIYYSEEDEEIKLIGSYEKKYIINNIKKEKEKQNFQVFEEKDLNYIYQKAFISKNKSYKEIGIKEYIKLYKDMIKLKKILNKLYNSFGYPLSNKIFIDVEKKTINCPFEKFNNLTDLKNHFYNIKKYCKDFYEEEIKTNKEIRFFYGKQIFLIYYCIKYKKYDKIKELLRSVSNGLIKNFDDLNFSYNDKMLVSHYENILKNIQKYILHQLNYNHENINKIYEKNKIKNTYQKSLANGFYFYLKGRDLELFLINLFFNITGNYPSINNLLLCNKDTTFEEIQSFINRAIYCEYNNLFIIAKCELLNFSAKRKLIQEIKEKSFINIENILVIVFSNEDSDFHKSILKIKNRINSYNFEGLKKGKENIDNSNEKIEIISSRGCGFGKSAYIKNKKEKLIGSKLIYFPLSGNFNRNDLFKRIEKIPNTFKNQNYIFHLILGQTQELEILKEFLFKLIIFRKCDFNNNVKYFGLNVDINIEIPNDFINYLEIMKFLLLYKNSNILQLEKIKLSSEVKIVSTYLLNFENNKLLSENINILNCDISQKQCEQLIWKYISNIDDPNFYQINTFVKILSKEFELFNNCSGLTPKNLILSGMRLSLRKIIIDSLIKVTKHFTIGPYEELIKSQRRTKEILNSEKEDEESYLGHLYLDIRSVNYDDINPSLVTFNKDGNSITIITTSDENQEDYKNLNDLYISQSLEFSKKFAKEIRKKMPELREKYKQFMENSINNKKINLGDYDDMEYISYLLSDQIFKKNKKKEIIPNKNNNNIIELDEIESSSISFSSKSINKEIPNLKNIKSLEPDEILEKLLMFLNVNGLSEKQMKFIVGNYIYTPDNFIKVILILMRLRAKIPVIMMGETGCGKTALIKMAYKLINLGNVNMNIMNIHAGTDDNDIIEFIYNTKNNIEKEDKILLEEKIMSYDTMPEKHRKEYEKTRTREQIIEEYKKEISNRKIWIFFDEINTCNSMGLLSEILCQHTIRGESLDERLVFIAACNPYRLLSKANKVESVLYHKNAKKKKLVYSVNPLPHSLLNFVFNFGALKEADEKKYIESMIKDPTIEIMKIYNKNNLIEENDYEKLMHFQVELINFCQKLMKEKNDVSIVSLREVNRFIIFFKFFVKFIIERNHYENDENIIRNEKDIISYYNNRTQYEIYECAINLSIYICYYLRLPDKNSRKDLESGLNFLNYFNNDFLKLPNLELDYLINNLEIPAGIAKNLALKEIIFSSFYCIVNKIPLIICGKPGKGKTLSIQLLNKSMRGNEGSKSYICKLFGEIIIHKIQGALNTTSEEIASTFKKARELQIRNPNKILLVLMDEMGLAELSKNNPLKVIHYELEKEEDKVSFVGISNWGLDASKMNRVVYIIGQEPEENDLIITAKEIVRSYEMNQKIKINYYEKYQTQFDNLSKAYFRFIETKKNQNNENAFFHGLRDFYSLIKTTTNDIILNIDELEGFVFNRNKREKKLNEICLKNIERNFGGLEDSINYFKGKFNEVSNRQSELGFSNNYDIKTCLKESLYDKTSRYLLIISDSIISKDLLFDLLIEINNEARIYEEEENNIINDDNIINKKNNNINIKNNYDEDEEQEEEEQEINLINFDKTDKSKNKIKKKYKEIKYFLGSKFKGDEDKIFYSDDMLNKIEYEMRKDKLIILKDLEAVYPSLYELFNQNFFELNGKKYTRLGKSQTPTLVNDELKIIVYLDKQNIPKEDPPFLNRFEKHIISISNILENKYISLANDIYEILGKIITFKLNDKKENEEIKDDDIILNRNLKFIENEEVQGLVFISKKQNKIKEDEIIEFILEKIVPTFTEDMIVYIQSFGFRNKYNFYYEKIINIYKNNYRYNIYDYLQKTKNRFSIIYTFSSINEKIFENNNKKDKKGEKKIKNDNYYQIFDKDSFKEIIISQINSINYLDKLIVDYISDIEKNLCLIKLKEEDLDKLENVINLVEDFLLNEENYNLINEENKIKKFYIILIHLSRTKIENNKNFNLNFPTYLSKIPQIFIDNINNEFDNFINIIDSSNEDIIFKVIKFEELIKIFENCFRNFSYEINDQNNNKNIMNFRSNILEKIKNEYKIKEMIKNSIKILSKKENNYLDSIFREKKIKKEDYDFMDTLNIYLSGRIEDYIKKLIHLYNQNQIFSCILSNKDLFKSEIIENYLNSFINNINNEISNKINLTGFNLYNKINQNILLGIKTPFIENILKENIFQYIKKSISAEYIQCNSYLMSSKISPENLNDKLEKYKSQMNKLKLLLKNEIFNYEFIKSILESDDIILIKNFFNDCFIIFLSINNNIKNNNNYAKLIQLLDIIIQIRLNPVIIKNNFVNINLEKSFFEMINNNYFQMKNIINEDDEENLNRIIVKEEEIENEILKINQYKKNYFDIFSTILIFIISYSKEIYDILELYNSILNENPINKIKKFITNNYITMDDERNPDYSKNLKCCFYYVIESLLMNLRLQNNIQNNQYNLYKKIQNIIPNIIKLEKNLLLFSKEIITLELINRFITYYDKQEKKTINKDEINKLISLFMNEPNLIKEKKYDELEKNIIESKILLKKLYGDTNEYGELINYIILNKLKILQKKDIKYKKKFLVILLEENKKNNLYLFINIILGLDKLYETKKFMDGELNKKFTNYDDDYQLKFVKNNQELILLYFENLVENYFISIKKEEINNKLKYDKLFGDISLKYLDIAIKNIESSIYNKEEINIIRKLYLIAYIKRYIINYIDLILSENIQNLGERNNINKSLFLKNTIIIKEIKYFTLKLLLKKFDNDYGKIIHLNNEIISNYIDYEQYFNNFFKNKESIILYYFSFPNIREKNNLFSLFGIKNNKNKTDINNNEVKPFDSEEYKLIMRFIKGEEEINNEQIINIDRQLNNQKYKYDILYTYISYIKYMYYINNNDNYLKQMKKIFNIFFEKELLNFNVSFNYFLKDNNNDELENILKKENEKNKKLGLKQLEILLYAFRFFFNIMTTNNNKNFYFLLTINFKDTITSNFIPGKIKNNKIKNSFEKIKENLINNPNSNEYMCSCGINYTLSKYDNKVICEECELKKNKKYNLFKKDYYGRIFLTKKEKEKYNSQYKNRECLLLDELEIKIDSQIKQEKGLKKESKEMFLKKNSDDNYISFRLMHFILYGFIFYSNLEGKISDVEMKNYLVEGMTCFEIIEKDWEILDKEVKNKQVPNIHIFLDNIFHEIISKINEQKYFKSENDLKKFEKSIEDIIKNNLKKYDDNSLINYIQNINKFIDYVPDEDLTIIRGEERDNNLILLRNKYPELEQFSYLKFSFEDFKNEFNYFEKNKVNYPIINSIINENSNIKYLQYIPKFNELCNYMIDYCSYKFTREEAKQKKINDELNVKNELINEFMDIFDILRPSISSYECHQFENKNDKYFYSIKNEKYQYLSYFCVDIGEFSYGMVLASIYKKMIEWQNSFINKILYSQKEIYDKYKDSFKNEIMIQNSNENDIINLPSKKELMDKYILKNICIKKYSIIDYNFKLIEEELASEILPKVKKFISDDDKCLKYVAYQYEGFRGNKNNIITLFNEKYERKELTKNECELIINFIKSCEQKGTKKIIDFWFSLQILIDIILENNYNKDTSISKVIEENNKYENLDNLNEFFGEENMRNNNFENVDLFRVNSMMSIFDFFELICWEKIKENLEENYLKNINNEIKQYIDIFLKNIKIITKPNLATAIRRFVSRYLSGKRGVKEISEDNSLIYYLYKEELWDEKNIFENPQFEIELISFPHVITIGQAVKVYEYLGEEIELYKQEKEEKKSWLWKINSEISIKIKSLFLKKNDSDSKKNININEEDLNDIYRSDSKKSISSDSENNLSSNRDSIEKSNNTSIKNSEEEEDEEEEEKNLNY